MSKKYPELIETVRWENDEVKLVQLTGLATGPGAYQRIPRRKVKAVMIHQAASAPKAGQSAPRGIARFHSGAPTYKKDTNGNLIYRMSKGKKKPIWIGGGKGWPGAGYHVCVPTHPDIEDGKAVVYQMHDFDIWSWHTSAAINKNGIGVVMSGSFRSEHDPNNPLAQPAPEPMAAMAMEQLVLQYILPMYNLTPEDGLYGHFDFGKAACPGDWLEQWVRHMRGENVPHPKDEFLDDPDPVTKPSYKMQFTTVKQRQEALLRLGYDLGPWGADGVWGEASKGALLGFQDTEGLTVDGLWGFKTDQAVKRAIDNAGA